MNFLRRNIKRDQLISRGESYTEYRLEGIMKSHTVGPVGLVALPSSKDFVEQVDRHLYKRRLDYLQDHAQNLASMDEGTLRDSYIIKSEAVRFQSGEGKGSIFQSVRGHDLYIFCDVTNHSISFDLYGQTVSMGPDDHFQDLVRTILACTGKANRINVIMPYLYEGRQYLRASRESLDCAYMLQQLNDMGVENIITFDPHDPRIENALPLSSVENVPVSFGLIDALLTTCPDIRLEGPDSIMIISPDEMGLKRSAFYASIMEVPLGTFYRQREHAQSANLRNQEIIDYKFLGESPEGRDVVIIDDMINSGRTLLETAKRLKAMKARKVYCLITFALFVDGLDEMQAAVDEGIVDRIFSTNLIYHEPELANASWYTDVDMSNLCALLIDALNHNASISKLIDQSESIKAVLSDHNEMRRFMDLPSQET